CVLVLADTEALGTAGRRSGYPSPPILDGGPRSVGLPRSPVRRPSPAGQARPGSRFRLDCSVALPPPRRLGRVGVSGKVLFPWLPRAGTSKSCVAGVVPQSRRHTRVVTGRAVSF